MKRVLVITYYWPPSGGSGVQRWVKFAKYLPQEGWQPVIYTPENPEYTAIDHTLEAEIPHDTEILRRPITEPYDHRNLVREKDVQAAPVAVDPRQPVRAGSACGLGASQRAFPERISGGTSGRCGRYDRSASFDASDRPAAAQGARDSLDSRFPRPVDPDVLP